MANMFIKVDQAIYGKLLDAMFKMSEDELQRDPWKKV